MHHYDEIGLVSASERTGAGHRRYTEADLLRLYRVRGLRQLGLSLEEIAVALERGSGELRDLFTAQLAVLEAQANRIAEMRDLLLGLIADPDPARVVRALELMSLTESYVSRDQRDALARRRSELGAERIEALRAEWLEVLGELRRHVVEGTPPEDPRVRELARRWAAVGEAFNTGDERTQAGVNAGVGAMWEANRDRLNEHLTAKIGWEGPADIADVVEYVKRVPR